jgi:hypothetical protein
MTQEERRDHTRLICRKLTAKVNELAPPGLGNWDRTWELVEGPSSAFLDALALWVDHDTPETREDVETTALALLVAWKEAAALYRLAENEPAPEVEVDRAHV